jgi:hypothetical protein
METAPFCAESADVAATRQRAFLRLHRWQLILVVTAAAVTTVPDFWDLDINPNGLVAAVLFGTSLVLRTVAGQRGDEEGWYSARKASESAKSLCYRYAFGATGMEQALPEADAESRFHDEFAPLGADVLIEENHARSRGYSEISDEMRLMRTLPFDELRDRYFTDRLEDQELWFSTRSAYHLRRSRLWLALMLAAEVGGVVFGILYAALGTEKYSFEGAVGLMSALAAAFLAWSQIRQHSTLAGAYREEAVDLRAFARRLPRVEEREWPAFVADVEASLLAEHSRWQSLIGFGR